MACCGNSGPARQEIGGYSNPQGTIYKVPEGVPVKTVLYVGKVYGKRNFCAAFATYPFGGSKESRVSTIQTEHAEMLVRDNPGEFLILDTDKMREPKIVNRLTAQLRMSKDVPLEIKERNALVKAGLRTVGSIISCDTEGLASSTKLSQKACNELKTRISAYVGLTEMKTLKNSGEKDKEKSDGRKEI